MNEAGVKKLAQLSRLELTNAEIAKYTGEISDILAYFDSLKSASSTETDLHIESSSNRNVMRSDDLPQNPESHTETLLASAPEHSGGYVKVKKIL